MEMRKLIWLQKKRLIEKEEKQTAEAPYRVKKFDTLKFFELNFLFKLYNL